MASTSSEPTPTKTWLLSNPLYFAIAQRKGDAALEVIIELV